MARTPLMQLLKTISRDIRISEARGMPIERVIAERKAGVSRREILAGSAAAAASLALPEISIAAGPRPRIAIVGAGIAGLNAALTLQDAGVTSAVYEASGRIGGRMFSNTTIWQDRQVSEWCGELIDTGHKTVRGLAARFGLPLDDLLTDRSLQETYKFLGQYYTPEQAYQDWKTHVQAPLAKDAEEAGESTSYDKFTPAGQALDRMSVAAWIDSRVPGGRKSSMGALLDVAYAIEYGADTDDQSALNLIYSLGSNTQKSAGNAFDVFGVSDERYHIRGGNQQLPERIARHLRNPVQLAMRLSSIARQSDGTYALDFNGQQTVAADIVILAIPFAVLRGIDCSRAGFDALKTTAIQELGRGRNGKLQLQFTSRYWRRPGAWPGRSNGSTYTDEGYQISWEVSRRQFGGAGILNNYTGGAVTAAKKTKTPYALASSADVQEDAKAFLDRLEQVLPGGTEKWNGRLTSSLPALDPNFGASYSYWRVGQYTSFAGYERVRQDNVFFAGEHTSTDFQGFMEGGASEGARAANDILDQIRARHKKAG